MTAASVDASSFPGGKSRNGWSQELTTLEMNTLVDKKDEPPWKGKYLHKFPRRGFFGCRGCKKPLYSTSSKFDGGAGWASFQSCYENSLVIDSVSFESDVEVSLVVCSNCGAYIGKVHVGEYRTVTNERHAVNSLSIVHTSERPPSLLEVTVVYVPESKNEEDNGLDKEAEALAARMLDFQIKSCKHLDSIIHEMKVLVRTSKTYVFNSDSTDAEFGELPVPKYVVSHLTKACFSCRERHTPLHRCRGHDSWVCLWPSCWGIYCTRYIDSHVVEKNHVVSVTPSMAAWCSDCNCFVNHEGLKSIIRGLHRAKFGTVPNSKDPTRRTGAKLLFMLGYGDASTCLCSACAHGEPVKHTDIMIPAPLLPIPRHPSYIKGATLECAVSRDKLLDRVKGLIYGAAMGSQVGTCGFQMTKKEIDHIFGGLMKSKKLCSGHASLRSKVKKKNPYRDGQWGISFDYFTTALSSLIAFGGRVEVKDMAYRLAHLVCCGIPAIEKKPHQISAFMNAVIQGDIEDYVLNSQHHAKRVYKEHQEFPHTANNDAMLRAIPVALRHFVDLNKVLQGTRAAVSITHASVPAVATSCCLNLLLAKMLNTPLLEMDRQGMVRLQLECFSEACKDSRLNQYQDKLRKYMFLEEEEGLEPLDLDDIKHCKDSFKTLGVAYATAHNNDPDFVHAIMEIIREGGDTMGNATIVGAIMGMKLGFSRLPSHWVFQMGQDRVWLANIVNQWLLVMGIKG
jgi:peptide-methionine (R)-S-oxide reductase